jgi:hypothetical protein
MSERHQVMYAIAVGCGARGLSFWVKSNLSLCSPSFKEFLYFVKDASFALAFGLVIR